MTLLFRAISAPTCVLLALVLHGCGGGGDDSKTGDSGKAGSQDGASEPGTGEQNAGEGDGDTEAGEQDGDAGEGAGDTADGDTADGDTADGDGGSGGGAAASGGATLSGHIAFSGDVPEVATKKVDLSGYPGCALLTDGADFYPNSLIKSEANGLANCFIYVDGPWEMDPPEEAAKIDQVKCRYTPKVMGVMCGQDLEIWNSDEENHNVHILPRANEEDNIGMPKPGKRVRSFPLKESVPIMFKCDLHPWMKAWVGVLPHPYFAVSDENGDFTISGVPAGEWNVIVWHELKGKQEHKVSFSEGGTATLDDLVFEF